MESRRKRDVVKFGRNANFRNLRNCLPCAIVHLSAAFDFLSSLSLFGFLTIFFPVMVYCFWLFWYFA